MHREFRKAKYHITVKNPKGRSKGIQSIKVDGIFIKGNYLPIFEDGGHHDVEVLMGDPKAKKSKTVEGELAKIGV